MASNMFHWDQVMSLCKEHLQFLGLKVMILDTDLHLPLFLRHVSRATRARVMLLSIDLCQGMNIFIGVSMHI